MLWDPVFMMEAIANPCAPNFNHSMVGKILNDSPANRYSFVCNVLMDVCVDHRDPERCVASVYHFYVLRNGVCMAHRARALRSFFVICFLLCVYRGVNRFQGERHRDPVCGADGVLPLAERGVARHPQGSLLLI